MSNNKTPTRIYAVHDAALDKTHLVRATNSSAAIRHVARRQYTAEVATQNQLVANLTSGGTVLDATAQDEAAQA